MNADHIEETEELKQIEGMDEAASEADEFQKKREEMKAHVQAKELIDAEISTEMRDAYLNYAMSVIVARALPSAEDGLKPVHRRILWAMNEMGVNYNKQTKKSGRIVGDVMGKYHPHGDASIYDAMVRMAQSWSLRYPLVIGQGNFGCFTADTEVKLVDGRNLSFVDLIDEHKQGKRNFTFTIDENNNIKIAEIKNPRKTKTNAEIMKVILDNGEEIKCTLNHKFMLKNGGYREAQDLGYGDSLMPCYFKRSTREDSSKAIGYSMVFQPRIGTWDFVHILSDDWNIENGIYEGRTGRIRHHVNFDKLNNNNLLLCELNGNHKVIGVEFIKKFQDVYDLTVDKTHNFALASGIFVHNSMDGDNAAASRYTEAKMEKISEELLMDIDKKTVEMMKNYDNTLDEPIVMPGKIPNLFLNGASGIAVGMATNIPPHNLGNTCDAIQIYLDNPNCEDKELIEAIKAPDFPTGGTVSGEIKQIYTEGRGRLVLDGKTVVEEPKRSKDKLKIIITEIPYQVNKATLVEQIAMLVRDKKLPDISDIRDESSKGKVRVVMELRKGAEEKFTLNRLYKYTQLRVSFNANMLALVNRVPKLLTLREYVKVYIGHRQTVIRKTKEFDLDKAERRLHIVDGLLIAQSNIDAVVKLIRAAKAKTDAAAQLKIKYRLSDKQVEAILEMKLHQITSLEFDKLKNEEKDLKELIEKLKKILGDEKLILKIIKKDLVELKETYGDARKTRIVGSVKELAEHDLVDKKDVVVTITEKGYIKRLDLMEYKEQKRGGRGVIGSDLTEDDFVKELLTCSTHDYMLFFTDKGNVHWLKAYEVPASAKSTKGKAIVNLLELKDEKVTSVLAVKQFNDFLMMATEKGVVKKIELSNFSNPRKGGIKAIKVSETGDTLIDVKPMKEGQEVLLVTQKGQAIRFKSGDVRSMGRASYGVTGIKMAKGDKVVSLEVLPLEDAKNFSILTITRKGYGKRSAIEDYRLTGRAGKGVINMKVTDKTGKIVTSQSVTNSDNIIMMSEKGIVIRTPVKNIRIMGRATQGVRVIKLKEGDKVSDLARVPTDEHIEEIAGE